jgi:hypothetical protein
MLVAQTLTPVVMDQEDSRDCFGSAILPIAFRYDLAYAHIPLENPCNLIDMTPPLPLRCVSGVIPNI